MLGNNIDSTHVYRCSCDVFVYITMNSYLMFLKQRAFRGVDDVAEHTYVPEVFSLALRSKVARSKLVLLSPPAPCRLCKAGYP